MIQQYHLSFPYIDDLGGNYIYNYFDVSSIISIYYVGLDSGAMGYV